MRKQVMHEGVTGSETDDDDWLDLGQLATVELTSEEIDYPIEGALGPRPGAGWRARQLGKQTIRLLFDEPQRIRRIRLEFDEAERARTQEFVLRWSPAGEDSWREIVRQQYNFSLPDGRREIEEYRVDLDRLQRVELTIVPDISGGSARASLVSWRLA